MCRCGLTTYRHLNHERCSGCALNPRFCRCVPVAAEPGWRKWTREHGNAKELAAA